MAHISVLAVDDHPVFADALQARLSAEPDLRPVSVAYSAREAASRLARSPVDVAVLDFRLGDATGTSLARQLRRTAPRTRIVMLTAVESVDAVVIALAAGVRAWLPKTVDTAHLVAAIRGVHSGDIWLSPELLGKIIPILLSRALAPVPDPLAILTSREREVLDCMVEGLSRPEIAARLHMSANTARTHTQNLIGKLGVHSSLEAVAFALRTSSYADEES
jgi:DNA-binding NarL/FixJ family response regulator